MTQPIAGRPCWELNFDKDGNLSPDPAEVVADRIAAAGVQNLFVFSHGWNTQTQSAEQLYRGIFQIVADQLTPAFGNSDEVGFAGVVWPSIWFPDQEGVAAGPAAIGAQAIGDAPPAPVNVDPLFTGAEIAAAYSETLADEQAAIMAELGRLIDDGLAGAADGSATAQQQQAGVERFHQLLQQLTAGADSQEDAGETALFDSDDPAAAYHALAQTMGSAPEVGDQQGLGDKFKAIWNGAKDALRVASFWQMKNRAGQVGQHGLAPLLVALHEKAPGLRVHLCGHSFGARLVSFSLAGLPSAAASPVASLVLLQGAFSHWAFAAAQGNPFGAPGALAGIADRVNGPLVATFSERDWAVGTWYPRASFLAQDNNQNAVANVWGGMGSDGFQASDPQADVVVAPVGTDYPFAAGTFYRVDGNAVIADTSQSAFAGAHSDILHDTLGWLTVAAARPR